MQCHLKELTVDFQNECEEAHDLTKAVYSPSSDPLKAIPAPLVPGFLVGWVYPGMYRESSRPF